MPSPSRPLSLLRWGFVFLACPLNLTEQQREDLVRLAVQAYMEDLPRIDFEWELCRGAVHMRSETASLGGFVGQRFTAEVHLPSGSGEVAFLVTERQLQHSAGPIPEA